MTHQIEKNKEQEYKNTVKEWLSNKRVLGLLGERVSGAILVNGSQKFRNKDYPNLLHRRLK